MMLAMVRHQLSAAEAAVLVLLVLAQMAVMEPHRLLLDHQ